MVAAGAVHAALRGVNEYALVHCGGADSLGDGFVRIEGRASGFVANEFDGKQKTKAAEVADMGMRLKRSKRRAKLFGGRSDAREEMVGLDVIENGVAGGSGDGMGLIREAMFERARAAFEGFDDVGRDEHCSQRSVAAGDSFAGENHVRLDAPMLNGEGLARAAEAGHDLVGDEQDVVLAADFGDPRGIALWRRGGAERCADNGFKNEGSSSVLRVGSEKGVEVVRAGELALRERFVKRTVVATAGSDVAPLGQQRRVRSAAGDIAADGHRAKGGAMVTLAAREDTEACGLATFEMKLARKLDGGFGGFRTTGSEIDTAILEIGRGKSEKACGKFLRRSRMELRGVGEGELRGLFGHRSADFRNAVADVDDGGLAGSVEELAAICGVDPAAFAADRHGK